MSWVKKSLVGLAVLVGLLGAAAAVFVFTFDANRYRSLILAQLSRSVDRRVEAAGLELQLLPLRVRLNQLRVPEAPGFAGEEFLRAEAVQLDLRLLSLLRGQPQLEALEVDRPTLYLRQNAAGEWNVATLAAPKAERAPAPATAPAAAPVRNWLLRDGTLVIERASLPPLRLTGVELALRDLSTTEAFPFRLSVSFSPESRVSAEGRLGPLDLRAPARTPLNGQVSLENFRPAALASVVAVPAEMARLGALSGTLAVESSPDGTRLTGEMAFPGSRPEENVEVKLVAQLPADFSRVELRDTGVDYAGVRVTAAGRVSLAASGTLDLTLAASNAELSALLRIPPRLGLALPVGLPPATGKLTAQLKASGPRAAWQLSGSAQVRDLSLTPPQLPEPVRIPALELALNPSELSAPPFTVQMGEKLSAQVGVRLNNYRTRPALEGQVETKGASLEALLGLLRVVGADPLPGGKASGQVNATIDIRGLLSDTAPPLDFSGRARLSGASVQPAALAQPLALEQAELEFTSNSLQVTNLHLTAAGMKIQGALRVDNFEVPRVSFDLRGDKLDVGALQTVFGAQPPPRPPRLSDLLLPVLHAQERTSAPGTLRPAWFARLSGRGRVEFDRVTHGTLTLAPFASPVAMANQIVTCEPIEVGLYDGGGRGRLILDLRGSEPVAEFSGLLRNVDANKLLSENTESKNRLHGRLGGKIEVRFVGSERPQIVRSAKGQGEVSLVNGRLAQVNLSRELTAVGQLAGLNTDQRDTPVEDLTTAFEISDGWVRTRELTLRTPELTMTAAGGFSLEDELAFESTATFTPEASQRMASRSPLGALAGSVFTDDQGRVMIPFLVRGTFAAPKFSLDAGRLAEMRMRGGRTRPGGTLGNILDRLRKPPQPPK